MSRATKPFTRTRRAGPGDATAGGAIMVASPGLSHSARHRIYPVACVPDLPSTDACKKSINEGETTLVMRICVSHNMAS